MSPAVAFRLRGEIEAVRPLQALDGKISITGWCLAEGLSEAPAVRMTTTAGRLTMIDRTARTDVPKLLPDEPAAALCGFVIEGQLPAGVYAAFFEALLPDGTWRSFKGLNIAVGPRSLQADIQSPAHAGTVNQRVHIEGWAFHPDQRIKGLALRYGHQEITCTLGGNRHDVQLLHRDSPHAAKSGFKSEVILSAGRGPLRLKARLDDGSIAIVCTALNIEVPTDENVGPEIDLAGARIALPGYARHLNESPADKSVRLLNILFILPGSFASNSALHVAALANELAGTGHACAVAVPHDLETLAHHEHPLFRGLTHAEADKGVTFPNGRGPDLIHAWTTRENVRLLAQKLRDRHAARFVVHLEDNEQAILALSLGRSVAELERMSPAALDRLIPIALSHPQRSREFLESADGVTVITDRLRDFVPTGRPCHTISPGADARYFFPRPIPAEFRGVLDPVPDATVLFYHGNAHAANAAEMRELYTAVLQLNQAGQPVTLLRTGFNQVDFLGAMADEVAPFVLELGQILHHRHLPPLMALADIFVQPGQPDAFNDYRFPSKLPEFFAIGRPVVLPRTNLGATLRHGVDAYVLDRADAAGIATAVRELRGDRALYDRLTQGAVAFAAQNFSWRRGAEALASFYASLTT
jgi:glycosyltransferase involved in cell wall biosynthesis